METTSNPSPPSPLSRVEDSGMDITGAAAPAPAAGEPAGESAGLWEWGSLLEFTIEDDDPLLIPWDPEEPPVPTSPPSILPIGEFNPPQDESPPPSTVSEGLSRVRKRDPRLICENFLAGRVPCSCPEVDEDYEEEEAVGAVAGGGRKKVRTGSAGSSAATRCQVPGCGADIRELKGYHRRHRVCLRCANATTVVLDGEPKRYCQQCGKFHVLSDFDEGKRSCRRKLERHNKRRRRRSVDYRNVVEKEKEPPGNLLGEDVACEEEPTKELLNGAACVTDSLCVSNKTVDTETSLEPEDGRGNSVPSSQNVRSNSLVSFAASGGTQMEERIDINKSAISSPFCDNKSTYSSTCPTGRISFKLYDWNPAEFPRRLRHQIFQWLASMPVELEGYIRPGCTFLTFFIAMPQSMWEKLFKEAANFVNDLVKSPESCFMGRRNMLIYLNNMIFQVVEDGTSLMNIKMEVHVPRLHYVHPTYFEAGKPVEFIACGSNLLRPKFRFLVSFAGKYMKYESSNALSHGLIKSCHKIEEQLPNSDHEIFRIRIPHTESELFGPAFVEVENESGVSNFIPILFGNKNICSEMERMQKHSSEPLCSDIVSQTEDMSSILGFCEDLVSRKAAMSELLMDVAWLLKKPHSDGDEVLSSSMHIQRLNRLLKHLLQYESVGILEKLLDYLDLAMKGKGLNSLANETADTDMELFTNYINTARELLHQKVQFSGRSMLDPGKLINKGTHGKGDSMSDTFFTMPFINQNVEPRKKNGTQTTIHAASQDGEAGVSLIAKETVQRAECCPHSAFNWQQNSWLHSFSTRINTHLVLFVMASVVMCCALCVALFHPHKAGVFVTTVRRCLFGGYRQ